MNILLAADRKQHKTIIHWANVLMEQEVIKGRIKENVKIQTFSNKHLSLTGEDTISVINMYWYCLGFRMCMDLDEREE